MQSDIRRYFLPAWILSRQPDFVRTQPWQCGTAFNVYYPPRLIIEVGSLSCLSNARASGSGRGNSSTQMAKNKFQIDRERDRVEELARLIAQAGPYGESTPADRFREESVSEGYDARPGLPPAPPGCQPI
jgi:hypothetical protein